LPLLGGSTNRPQMQPSKASMWLGKCACLKIRKIDNPLLKFFANVCLYTVQNMHAVVVTMTHNFGIWCISLVRVFIRKQCKYDNGECNDLGAFFSVIAKSDKNIAGATCDALGVQSKWPMFKRNYFTFILQPYTIS
jgi:hypothetical protein